MFLAFLLYFNKFSRWNTTVATFNFYILFISFLAIFLVAFIFLLNKLFTACDNEKDTETADTKHDELDKKSEVSNDNSQVEARFRKSKTRISQNAPTLVAGTPNFYIPILC